MVWQGRRLFWLSTEMSEKTYNPTPLNNPDNCHLSSTCCEGLKTYTSLMFPTCCNFLSFSEKALRCAVVIFVFIIQLYYVVSQQTDQNNLWGTHQNAKLCDVSKNKTFWYNICILLLWGKFLTCKSVFHGVNLSVEGLRFTVVCDE